MYVIAASFARHSIEQRKVNLLSCQDLTLSTKGHNFKGTRQYTITSFLLRLRLAQSLCES